MKTVLVLQSQAEQSNNNFHIGIYSEQLLSTLNNNISSLESCLFVTLFVIYNVEILLGDDFNYENHENSTLLIRFLLVYKTNTTKI